MHDAYQRLCRDRPIGLAVGPIPWSSIDRYIERALARDEIDEDEGEGLEELILMLDDQELLAIRRQAEAGEGKQVGDKSPARRRLQRRGSERPD